MSNNISTTALAELAVLPVLTGAVLTALFTWLAQRRTDNRLHAQWLRERRFDSYSEFIRAVTEFMFIASVGIQDRTSATLAVGSAATRAQAIAPEGMRKDIGDFVKKMQKVYLGGGKGDYGTQEDRIKLGEVFSKLRDKMNDALTMP